MRQEGLVEGAFKDRGVNRIPAEFQAFLRFEKWPALPVVICDLSSRGFKCRTLETLMIGWRVILRIPDVGQYSATVRWQIGDCAGALFDSRLSDQAVMAMLLSVLEAQKQETDKHST